MSFCRLLELFLQTGCLSHYCSRQKVTTTTYYINSSIQRERTVGTRYYYSVLLPTILIVNTERTYCGYSGTWSLCFGASATYLLYIHLTLKWRFMYSELLHSRSFSCSDSQTHHQNYTARLQPITRWPTCAQTWVDYTEIIFVKLQWQCCPGPVCLCVCVRLITSAK